METKQETCAQRIDEKLKGREEDLRALLDNPDSDWGQDDPALSIQKREIVEMITERITVGQEEIHLSLSHIPTLSKMAEKSNAAMPVWLL